MIRTAILFFLYLLKKIKDLGKVRYNGFTVIYSFPDSSISIGKGTTFNSSSLSNLLGIYQRCICVARYGGKIRVGKNCGISGSTIYSMSSIEIGDNVLVGANCKIIDNDFHPLLAEIRKKSRGKEGIQTKPVRIGDGCFIGANSIILKGSTLGKNCVVGAGSVVCGEFPDGVIIAGNPARIIKENIIRS